MTKSFVDKIISEGDWVLKIMAHEIEQIKKQPFLSSFCRSMILSYL